MPETNTRRERRAAARQSQILEAAAHVFAEKGFQHATIHDVAEAADVADGTIYNYFDNKDDLLYCMIDRLAAAEQQPLLLGDEALTATITGRMRLLHAQYEQVIAVLPEILGRPELRARYLEQFVQPVAASVEHELAALAAQHGQELPDVRLAARVVLSAVLGFQVLMILDDPLTHAAWERPEVLAEVWSRFITFGLK